MKIAVSMVLAMTVAGNVFAAGGQVFKRMEISALDYTGMTMHKDSIVLADGDDTLTFTCVGGSRGKVEIVEGAEKQTFVVTDFYSAGCKQLLRDLTYLGVREGDSVEVKFFGENAYPGLVIESHDQSLLYTPAGNAKGVFKRVQ